MKPQTHKEKNWNRGIAIERPVGKVFGDLNQFYSRETSPLIVIITKTCLFKYTGLKPVLLARNLALNCDHNKNMPIQIY